MGCGSSRQGSHVVSPLSKAVILPHIAWINPNTNNGTKVSNQKPSDVILLEKGVQVDNLLDLVDRTTQTDLPFSYTEDIQELLDDNQNFISHKSNRESKTSGGRPARRSAGTFSREDNPMQPLRPLISDVETQTHQSTETPTDDVKSVLVQTEHHIVVLGRRMMHLDIKQQANKVTIDIGIQVVNSKTDHFTQTDLMVITRRGGTDKSELKNVKNLLRVQSSDPTLNFKRDKQILLNNKNYLELPTTADFEAQTDPVARALAANAADSDINIFDTIDASPIAHIEKELENGQMTIKGAAIHDSIARLLEDVEDSLTEPSVSVSYRVVEVPKRDSAVQTDNDPITDEAPEFAARPPPCKKREMIPNMAVFKDIDHHVAEVPESSRSSLKNLVQYLTTPCINDLQKVRAFFKWIANNITYDWRYMEIKMSAEEVLRRGEGVCKDYCKLFSEMCKIADIRCKKLHGFAKGYDYRPGHCFKPGEDITHAWNAVFIFGAWRLIDTTWGTGYTDHTGRFQRKINEHFFLTDPEIMVWTHFPHDEVEKNYSRWQLVDKPVDLEVFNSLPKVTPFFFEYCLKVRTRPQNPVTFKVQTEIKLSSHEPMRYKFKLYPADELENSSLNSYVFCQLKEDRLVGSFSVIPPVEGTYYLKIYAKSEREMKNDTSLHNVVIFFLDCIRARKYLQPYPVNEIPWGPTQIFFDYKMKLINHSGPVIATWGGRRKLTMEYNEHMVITMQLFDADGMEMDVKGTIQREDSDKRVIFTVTPIRMGYFKFLIFGMPKPKSKGKWRMPLLASFLIDCKLCRTPDEDNPAKVQAEQNKDAEGKDGKKKEKKKMRPMMMR